MRWLLMAFFRLLYHQLAWAYDFVAGAVSLGQWNAWGFEILAFLRPGRILELGFGPGHLQLALRAKGWSATGLDESKQMIAQANRRLAKGGYYPALTRGRVQTLPFASSAFETIFSTFPAPFIFEPATAAEIERTLKPRGRFVALLAHRPSGTRLRDRFIRALFTLTREYPPREMDTQVFIQAYVDAGLEVRCDWHKNPSGDLLVIEAIKH
jgi:ubiquinone/menaquinone biosynthesis C-methylase UbiE